MIGVGVARCGRGGEISGPEVALRRERWKWEEGKERKEEERRRALLYRGQPHSDSAAPLPASLPSTRSVQNPCLSFV